MKQLVDAVSASIVAEVTGANTWTVEKYDPLWRNPAKGKVLNCYAGRRMPGTPRWTGGTMDIVEVVVEYGEVAQNQARTLDRDETAELAAYDTADSIRTWAANHEEGFAPAWKMDWVGTEYTPTVARELFVRYCRLTLAFEVQVNYG